MPRVPSATPFVHPIAVRYLEVDQQGVVFNMWYLAYLDDAMTAFLVHGGLPYAEMTADGFDVQLVHSEIDWQGSLTFSSSASIAVALAKLGRTSFTLQFEVRSSGQRVAAASTVYVSVRTDGSGKCQIPPVLAEALGPVAPLWD